VRYCEGIRRSFLICICGVSAVSLFLPLRGPALPLPKDRATQKESLDFQGHKRTYYLFVPTLLAVGTAAPLIVLLHRPVEDGASVVEPWRDLASKEGIILVAPDSARSNWELPSDGPDFVRAVVEAVEAKYGVDRRRVYLFGPEGGGTFALALSFLESQYFAATAVYGATMPGDGKLLEAAKRKLPIAMWDGLDPNGRRIPREGFASLPLMKRSQQTLKLQGFPVELHEVPGPDSYFRQTREVNAEVWEFLRQQQLQDLPTFEAYKP